MKSFRDLCIDPIGRADLPADMRTASVPVPAHCPVGVVIDVHVPHLHIEWNADTGAASAEWRVLAFVMQADDRDNSLRISAAMDAEDGDNPHSVRNHFTAAVTQTIMQVIGEVLDVE